MFQKSYISSFAIFIRSLTFNLPPVKTLTKIPSGAYAIANGIKELHRLWQTLPICETSSRTLLPTFSRVPTEATADQCLQSQIFGKVAVLNVEPFGSDFV
jgi:hypothetical protein